jgi:hypothetical protein
MSDFAQALDVITKLLPQLNAALVAVFLEPFAALLGTFDKALVFIVDTPA